MTLITVDARMINSSGIGTYIENLLPRVIRLRPDDVFYILGKTGQLQQFEWMKQPNVHMVECSSSIYSISEQWKVPSCIPKETSLYWSPHYNIPILYKGKMLVTIHDLFHLAMKQYNKGLKKQLYAKLMFAVASKKAALINTISNFTKNELLRFTHVNENKIHITPLGVGHEWFAAVKDDRPIIEPYLIFVGNVKPNKNLRVLIQAFERIKDLIPHKLVIVGKKDGFITGDPDIDSLAAKLGDRIVFTGYISKDSLIQHVSHADSLIFPSLYEGFGLPPLEAMACGCPVIASHAASIPEVCGDAVLYCDPYDAEDVASKIQLQLNDDELRTRLIDNGFNHVKKYSWDICAGQIVKMMDEVISL